MKKILLAMVVMSVSLVVSAQTSGDILVAYSDVVKPLSSHRSTQQMNQQREIVTPDQMRSPRKNIKPQPKRGESDYSLLNSNEKEHSGERSNSSPDDLVR